MAAGPGLLAGIAGVVAAAILLSYGICRALRLPRRMAVLVACGNSICGNSAIAAVAPVIHIGTLVKLVRVLMLGPVVLCLSLVASRLREETDEPAPHLTAGDRPKPGRIAVHHLVPWFILGFLALAGVRSAGLIPEAALVPVSDVASVLTVLSMAALGLGVDVRVVARAGLRVVLAVTASLLALGAVSLGLIRVLGIAG